MTHDTAIVILQAGLGAAFLSRALVLAYEGTRNNVRIATALLYTTGTSLIFFHPTIHIGSLILIATTTGRMYVRSINGHSFTGCKGWESDFLSLVALTTLFALSY